MQKRKNCFAARKSTIFVEALQLQPYFIFQIIVIANTNTVPDFPRWELMFSTFSYLEESLVEDLAPLPYLLLNPLDYKDLPEH